MFQLKQLGPYRIEPTEEYIPGAADNSYAEMLRVRGSKTEPPYFMVPSHLYKYSESELGLYLKEHKNLWRQLGRLLDVGIDIHDAELIVQSPVLRFPEMAKIVPFVKKRGSFSNPELAKMYGRGTQFVKGTRHKSNESNPNFNERAPDGDSIPPSPKILTLEGSR